MDALRGLSFNNIDNNRDGAIQRQELQETLAAQDISAASLQDPAALDKLVNLITLHFKEQPGTAFNLTIDGAQVRMVWGTSAANVAVVDLEQGSGSGGAIATGRLSLQQFNDRIRVSFAEDKSGHAEFPGRAIYKFSLGMGQAGISDEAMLSADSQAEIRAVCDQAGPGTGVSLSYMRGALQTMINKLNSGSAQDLDAYQKTLLQHYQTTVEDLVVFLQERQAQEITLNGQTLNAPFAPESMLLAVLQTHAEQMSVPGIDLERNNGAFQIIIAVTKENPVAVELELGAKPHGLAEADLDIIRGIPRRLGEFGNSAKFTFDEVFPGMRNDPRVSITVSERGLSRAITPARLGDDRNLVYEYNVVVRNGELQLWVTLNDSASPINDTSVENRYTFIVAGEGLADYLRGMTIDEQTRVARRAGGEEQVFLVQVFEDYIKGYLRNNIFSIQANYIDRLRDYASADISKKLEEFFVQTFGVLTQIDPEVERQVMRRLNTTYGVAGAGHPVLDGRYARIITPALRSLQK